MKKDITRSLKLSFNWKIIKRGKHILNYCSTAIVGGMIASSAATSAIADNVAADALPTNPVTEIGSATYSYGNKTHTVDMGSSYVKTRYDSYNIGRDAAVNINGSGTMVNRVTGGDMSQIYGKLSAPGVNVFILNKSGVIFNGSSQVNVGSLIATTANDVTFDNNGLFEFKDFGNGTVANHGNINVQDGGFAVLAAPYVENSGYIFANLGKIELASTKAMTVDLTGDGLINYVVSNEDLEKIGITNTGTLSAKSGVVKMSSNALSQIANSVINLDGVVDADSFAPGENGGTVIVSSKGDINFGDVVVSANGANGGEIKTWADGVNNISKAATIAATGDNNGGTIDISGNNFVLAGDIDVTGTNSNGTIIIDPITLEIKNGTGASSRTTTLNTVYETWVENQLQSGTDVELEADNIILRNLADNVLQGGRGNLTLTGSINETGDITFEDKNDTIFSTSGHVKLYTEGKINIGHIKVDNSSETGTAVGSISIYGQDDITIQSLSIKGTSQYGSKRSRSGLPNSTITINADGNSNTNLTIADGISIKTKTDTTGTLIGANAQLYIYKYNAGDITIGSANTRGNNAIDISATADNIKNINTYPWGYSNFNLSSYLAIEAYEDVNVNVIGNTNVNSYINNNIIAFVNPNNQFDVNSSASLYTDFYGEKNNINFNGNINVASQIIGDPANKTNTANLSSNAYSDVYNDGKFNVSGDFNVLAKIAGTTSSSANSDTYIYFSENNNIGGNFNIAGNLSDIAYIQSNGSSNNSSYSNIGINDNGITRVGGNILSKADNNTYGSFRTNSAHSSIDLDNKNTVVEGNIDTIAMAKDKSLSSGNGSATARLRNDNNNGEKYSLTASNITVKAISDKTSNAIFDNRNWSSGQNSELDINSSNISVIAESNADISKANLVTQQNNNIANATFNVDSNNYIVNINGNINVASKAIFGIGKSKLHVQNSNGKDISIKGNINVTNETVLNARTLNHSFSRTNNSSTLHNDVRLQSNKNLTVVGNINSKSNLELVDSKSLSSSSAIYFNSENAFYANGDANLTGNVKVENNGGNNSETNLTMKTSGNINVNGDLSINSNMFRTNYTDHSHESHLHIITPKDADIRGEISNIVSPNEPVYTSSSSNDYGIVLVLGRNNVSLSNDKKINVQAAHLKIASNISKIQQGTFGIPKAQITISSPNLSIFNSKGFNEKGIHRDTGTLFDKQGFNAKGFNASGFDSKGFNVAGFSRAGFDRQGFNKAGFNSRGINKATGKLYGPNGLDKSGNPRPVVLVSDSSRNDKIIEIISSETKLPSDKDKSDPKNVSIRSVKYIVKNSETSIKNLDNSIKDTTPDVTMIAKFEELAAKSKDSFRQYSDR